MSLNNVMNTAINIGIIMKVTDEMAKEGIVLTQKEKMMIVIRTLSITAIIVTVCIVLDVICHS